jgi:uroporphyrinogen decarboxylase
LPYIAQICDAITEVPVTVFAKGAFFAREDMGKLNCDVVGLDWNMDIAESRKLVGIQKHYKEILIHVYCIAHLTKSKSTLVQ